MTPGGWVARWLARADDDQDAHALLRAGRLADAERAFAGRALARPRDRASLVALGHLALLRDDLEEAERRLARARGLGARQDVTAYLAEVHYRRDDPDQAAALWEAAGRRALAAKLRSFAGRRPHALEGPAVVRLPFVRRDPLPVVAGRVNGHEGRFLLDTGGGEVVLDAAFAHRVNARRFGRERGGLFGGGKRAAVEHASVDSLELGALDVRDVPAQLLDLQAMGTAVEEPGLAGILGTVLFYRLRATLDYPGEQLVLRRKDAPPGAEEVPDDEVSFWMAGDHFVVAEGTLNDGPPTLFFVDTGLTTAFTGPASSLRSTRPARHGAAAGQGTGGGGAFAMKAVEVGALALGPVRREGLEGLAGAFPPQLEWAFGFRIGGLVSHRFFLPYALTFDFARMRLGFRQAVKTTPKH